MSTKASFLQRGGAWVFAQSALMTATVLLGVVFHGDWSRTVVILAGTALFLAGGVVGIAGVWVLGKNRTPFPHPREGSALVQHGIYAHVRHPLYLSVMLASLGWVLICQSWPALVAALVLIPFFRAKASSEERRLRDKFPGYEDYENRVPRFVPRVWRR